MVKRSLMMLFVSLILLYGIPANGEEESLDWDAKSMLYVLDEIVDDICSGNDYDLSIYNKDTIRLKLDYDTDKDTLIANKSQFADAWNGVVNSFGDASKRINELFESVGYGDKFFVLSIVDNVYDETSDVWFVSVNGNTVYDVLK